MPKTTLKKYKKKSNKNMKKERRSRVKKGGSAQTEKQLRKARLSLINSQSDTVPWIRWIAGISSENPGIISENLISKLEEARSMFLNAVKEHIEDGGSIYGSLRGKTGIYSILPSTNREEHYIRQDINDLLRENDLGNAPKIELLNRIEDYMGKPYDYDFIDPVDILELSQGPKGDIKGPYNFEKASLIWDMDLLTTSADIIRLLKMENKVERNRSRTRLSMETNCPVCLNKYGDKVPSLFHLISKKMRDEDSSIIGSLPGDELPERTRIMGEKCIPQEMDCGHNICRECLDNMKRHTSTRNVDCPLCREPVIRALSVPTRPRFSIPAGRFTRTTKRRRDGTPVIYRPDRSPSPFDGRRAQQRTTRRTRPGTNLALLPSPSSSSSFD